MLLHFFLRSSQTSNLNAFQNHHDDCYQCSYNYTHVVLLSIGLQTFACDTFLFTQSSESVPNVEAFPIRELISSYYVNLMKCRMFRRLRSSEQGHTEMVIDNYMCILSLLTVI